jgi:hypothetical protein
LLFLNAMVMNFCGYVSVPLIPDAGKEIKCTTKLSKMGAGGKVYEYSPSPNNGPGTKVYRYNSVNRPRGEMKRTSRVSKMGPVGKVY